MSQASPRAALADARLAPSAEAEPPRPLPSPRALLAFARRNVVFAALVGAAYAPFALIAVLKAGKTYDSSVIIKYDPGDSLDPEATFHTGVGATFTFLGEQSKDAEFYLELARRYYEAPEASVLEKLPVPGGLKRKLIGAAEAPSNDPQALDARARQLRKQLVLMTDHDMAQANVTRLTASAGTGENAQRLAAVAAQLMLDNYYDAQAKRAGAVTASLSKLLENQQVKTLVDKAVQQAKRTGGDRTGVASKDEKQADLDLRQRQQELQERIKDVNVRLAANRERRIKLEAEVAELAQRYGPYHPSIRGLQNQIAELSAQGKQKSLSDELNGLQDQYLAAEAEAAFQNGPKELETVDKVVQKLTTKLDRYSLEKLNLEQQLKEPDKRLRLALLGPPSLPLEATSSRKPKVAALVGALGAMLLGGLVLLRELASGKARDPWRVSWQTGLHCLAEYPRGALQAAIRLDSEVLGSLRSQLLARAGESKGKSVLLAYRQLSQWLRAKARGNVVLVAKGGPRASCGRFLAGLANVHASDYAGRVLVIDLDPRDPVHAGGGPVADGGSVLDYLTKQRPWKEVCRPKDGGRAFDLVPAPAEADARLAELVSSPAMAELIASAQKVYKLVLIAGLGPDQFVENASVLAHATDALVLVDSASSTYAGLSRLVRSLDAEKLGGFVHLEA